MKRLMKLLCCLMILVILPRSAGAYTLDSEAKWNQQCLWRTNRTTPIYSAEQVDGEWVFTQIGTVAAGKWLGSRMYGMDGMSEMSYWNNGMRDAFFPNDSITKMGVTIYDAGGNSAYIPQMAYGDEAAVRYYLSTLRSPEQIDALVAGMKQGLSGKKDENVQIVIVKKEPLTPPVITLQREGGSTEVDMVLPGVARSIVKLEGAETTVPTAELQWELGGAEQALATIYAPRSGLASLYARDDGRGGVIKKLKAGSVVLVLGESGKYTKVYGENTVGYVITSALKFHDPCTGASEVTVTTRTNLCLNAEGRKLIDLPAGATVLLIKRNNNWSQVEYEGFVGFMETRKMRE